MMGSTMLPEISWMWKTKRNELHIDVFLVICYFIITSKRCPWKLVFWHFGQRLTQKKFCPKIFVQKVLIDWQNCFNKFDTWAPWYTCLVCLWNLHNWCWKYQNCHKDGDHGLHSNKNEDLNILGKVRQKATFLEESYSFKDRFCVQLELESS